MRQSNLYTFIFIIITALVSALVLSVTSQSLSKKQALNIENDMKKNILLALGVYRHGECYNEAQQEYTDNEEICNVKCCYKKYVRSYVIDYKGNVKQENIIPERIDIRKEFEKPESERSYPIFTRVRNDKIEAYCIPIIGKGLWSTLYGYIALEKDLNTVSGITFYKHGETPGLGAEIEKDWFLENFVGKKILNNKNELVSVKVVKGQVKSNSPDIIHEVDGISGATLTGNGVTELLLNCLALYEPYFRTIRKEVR